MRTPTRTAAVAALAVGTLGMSVGSVVNAGTEPVEPADVGTIVVGSADFPESELLAQIYGQALEAAGFDVDYSLAIGSREVYFGAIEAGDIQLVPEYTNSLLSFVLAPEPAEAANLDEQLAALDEVLPDGLEVLTPSIAEDKDVIVCTQEIVDELGFSTLSELAEVADQVTLVAPPEFEERTPFGVVGFREILGAEFGSFEPLAYGDIPAALSGGAADCGNQFSTGSSIAVNDFVVIEDDIGFVPAENVLPLIRSEVATPEAVAALDQVSAALDTAILTDLVAQVEVEALGADVVAADWLASDPQPVEVPMGTEPMEPMGTEGA